MQGWISLHRSMLDWEWYDDINVCRFFVHCLLRANHAGKTWKGILIKRGEFIGSLDKLSRETGLSVSQIRTCLKKLKSTGEMTSKSHTQHTVFIINNYDKYQDVDRSSDKPVTNGSQTNDKRIATNNNDNNENNVNKDNKDNKDKGKAKRFTPPSLQEAQSYFAERGCPDSYNQAESFVDYYTANGWKAGRNPMKDWRAAIRNWMKRSFNQPAQQGFNQPQETPEEQLARLDAEGFFDDLDAQDSVNPQTDIIEGEWYE